MNGASSESERFSAKQCIESTQGTFCMHFFSPGNILSAENSFLAAAAADAAVTTRLNWNVRACDPPIRKVKL